MYVEEERCIQGFGGETWGTETTYTFCILADNQVAIEALNNFQINPILVWDCDQSLVKLVEHNRVQLIWMPGHMGIEGNKIVEKLAMEGF